MAEIMIVGFILFPIGQPTYFCSKKDEDIHFNAYGHFSRFNGRAVFCLVLFGYFRVKLCIRYCLYCSHAAMQAMNRAIQNPAFFLCFFGTAILLPVCTYQHYAHPVPVYFWLLLAATILYFAGVLGITFWGNVPLNQALDRFQVGMASTQEITAQRAGFESLWNRLNNIRTAMSILAFILVIVACIYRKDKSAF